MATMITEVYDAFLAGGAPEAKARKAAEALSSESLSTKGDIVKTEGRLARDIAEVREGLADNIVSVEQKLTRDIAAAEERLNQKIAEVREELSGEIAAVREELSGKIATVEQRLNHKIDNLKRDITKLDRDMAVMKALLLIIIAVQVIPLLKALSVI